MSRSAARTNTMLKVAWRRDGHGPELFRHPRSTPNQHLRLIHGHRPVVKTFSPYERVFEGYEEFSRFVYQRLGVGYMDLIEYLNRMNRGENPLGFTQWTRRGQELVLIYMVRGRYGVVDAPTLSAAAPMLREMKTYMQREYGE